MTNPLIYRRGTIEDIPAMLELFVRRYSEVTRKHTYQLDIKYMVHLLTMMINSTVGAAFLVEDSGVAVGFMWAVIQPHQWDPSLKSAQNLCWYVIPGADESAWIELGKMYEAWAKSLGASRVMLGVVNNRDNSRAIGVCRKLGYKQRQLDYWRDI